MSRFARYAWATLAYNLAVILWGAIVRATGSGAGCGSHWPLCNGEVIPRAPAVETLIEYSHRLTSGVALLLVIGLFVAARRTFPKGHAARFWSGASLFFILTEAAVGAGLVLFELVADNRSMARALFMGTHLINTFFLLAVLALCAHHAGSREGGDREGARGAAAGLRVFPQGADAGELGSAPPWALVAGLLGTLVVGCSGAVAALGDTLFPAGSLAEALAQDLSPTAHALIRLRVLHPLLAVAVGVGLVALAVHAGRSPAGRGYAQALGALVLAQTLVGTLNVALLAPIWLQVVHLLLADLLWIALVLLAAATWPQHAASLSVAPAPGRA